MGFGMMPPPKSVAAKSTAETSNPASDIPPAGDIESRLDRIGLGIRPSFVYLIEVEMDVGEEKFFEFLEMIKNSYRPREGMVGTAG